MGKMFTRLVKAFALEWEQLDERINEKLEELGNPRIIDVNVFETEYFEGLCALLVLEEK